MTNLNNKELDTKAWYDPTTDMIFIRIRRVYEIDGMKHRRGLIIIVPEDKLCTIGKGQAYPQYSDDRFEQIIEEL